MRLDECLKLGESAPTYFIADIAANHDGDLQRALELIRLAAASGANAAKFQNFLAETIVSRRGFQELGEKLTHQKKWDKDVFEVYKDAELPIEWTEKLVEACKKEGIEYFTAPYDLGYISYFSTQMDYFKIGSGDITWKASLEEIRKQNKPILLATGASSLQDVEQAMAVIEHGKSPIVLMQCNTNYTGEANNFEYLNLNVLKSYATRFPNVTLGLSDHSQGHIAVLGAVTLGARVIEKHFTDDCSRKGPDHAFSLDPKSWRKMVEDTRILESCLGDGVKRVEENEVDAQVVQRRALRFKNKLQKGHVISEADLISLRPCPKNSFTPFQIEEVLGRTLLVDVLGDSLVTGEVLS